MELTRIYYLKRKRNNSRYYPLALKLWRNYMPSLISGIDYLGFERLMGQFPEEADIAEVIWNDLVEKGNLE